MADHAETGPDLDIVSYSKYLKWCFEYEILFS